MKLLLDNDGPDDRSVSYQADSFTSPEAQPPYANARLCHALPVTTEEFALCGYECLSTCRQRGGGCANSANIMAADG
eukprot:23993-Eustigmatos_ZCMA.PRE.1